MGSLRTDQVVATGSMPWIESNWAYDTLGRVTSQTVQKGANVGGAAQGVAQQTLAYFGNDDPSSLVHTMGASGANANSKTFTFDYDWRHQFTSAVAAQSALGGTGSFATAGFNPRKLAQVCKALRVLVDNEAYINFKEIKDRDDKVVGYELNITAKPGQELSEITKDLMALDADSEVIVTIFNLDSSLANSDEEAASDNKAYNDRGPDPKNKQLSVADTGGAQSRRSPDGTRIGIYVNLSKARALQVCGSSGQYVEQTNASILGHELGGHGPKKMHGGLAREREINAIKYENRAIRQKLDLPQRYAGTPKLGTVIDICTPQ